MRPADTPRLRFRCWAHEDLPLAMAIWGDPEVTRFVGGPFSAAEVAGKLATELQNQCWLGLQYWPIFTHDGAHVGCCGCKPRPDGGVEFGFYLTKPHWGRGYATEAGREVIRWAFEEHRVPRLFAGHHPENAASAAALQKLGFVRTHEELYPPTGLIHPGYTHSGGASAS